MRGNGFIGGSARGMFILIAAAALSASASAADVTSTWAAGASGNWSDATKWSSDPWFPNNGNDGKSYDAVIGSGTITLDQNVEINGLALSGGTISGGNQLALATGATWTGGGMTGGGSATIASGATLTISGFGMKTLGYWTLANAGTIALASSGLNNPSTGTGPRIDNQSTGIFDVQGNYSLNASSAPACVFDNAGTFQKSAGTGTSYLESRWTFNNTGTVRADSGTLEFRGGGTSTGLFDVAAGAAISFSGGTQSLTGASFANAGTINFSGATANFNDPISLDGAVNFSGGTINVNGTAALGGTVTLSGAILASTGSITMNSGSTLAWTAGRMRGGGSLNVASGAALTIGGSATKTLADWTLDNAGTITLAGTGLYNPTTGAGPRISNQSSGVFDIQGDYSLSTPYSATCVFDNAGVLQKSAGTGNGYLDARWTVTNTGTVRAQSGTLEFRGAFTQNAGAIELAGGNIAFSSPAQIAGGEILGSGTITGSVVNTAGAVSPGESAGAIAISGNYTQGAAGVLQIDLGGLDAGESDFIDVDGSALLDGVLEVALLGDYRPSQGDTFRVMDYASHTGEFASVVVPGSTAFSFTPQYASDGLNLIAQVLVSPPGDANRDGFIDAADAGILATYWGQPGDWDEGDFNDDGIVNAADASIMAANWAPRTTESAAVPEPSAIAMILALAGMLVGRLPHRRTR